MSARIAGRLAGIKSIVFTRHCMGRKIEGSVGKLLNRLINKGLSDRVIAVSQSVRENLVSSGIPTDMIELIYNGVETLKGVSKTYKQRIREYWGIKRDEIVVGIIARLEEIKGHNIFLKAAYQVIKGNIPVKFIIVGSGSLEKELKDLTKELDIDDKIIFTGHLQDISEVMNIIDINVLSSFSEALSLSLIEAMSLENLVLQRIPGAIRRL